MDEAVRRWRQTGQIYFWFERERRNGDGWHLAADPSGCGDLRQIIRLAREARFPSRFVIAPTPSASAPETLTLAHDNDWQADHWTIRTDRTSVVWELGADRLRELGDVVSDLESRDGDYAFGGEGDGQRVWVWWPPS